MNPHLPSHPPWCSFCRESPAIETCAQGWEGRATGAVWPVTVGVSGCLWVMGLRQRHRAWQSMALGMWANTQTHLLCQWRLPLLLQHGDWTLLCPTPTPSITKH